MIWWWYRFDKNWFFSLYKTCYFCPLCARLLFISDSCCLFSKLGAPMLFRLHFSRRRGSKERFSRPNWSKEALSTPRWHPPLSTYFKLSLRQFCMHLIFQCLYKIANDYLNCSHCCNNCWCSEAMSDHRKVRKMSLHIWVHYWLRSCVTKGRPVLIKKFHELLADVPDHQVDRLIET